MPRTLYRSIIAPQAFYGPKGKVGWLIKMGRRAGEPRSTRRLWDIRPHYMVKDQHQLLRLIARPTHRTLELDGPRGERPREQGRPVHPHNQRSTTILRDRELHGRGLVRANGRGDLQRHISRMMNAKREEGDLNPRALSSIGSLRFPDSRKVSNPTPCRSGPSPLACFIMPSVFLKVCRNRWTEPSPWEQNLDQRLSVEFPK